LNVCCMVAMHRCRLSWNALENWFKKA